MRLLAVGDVCGETALQFVEKHLRDLRGKYSADVCVVNGENADVLGILPEQAQRIYHAGADIVTLGNHTWNRRQIGRTLDENGWIIRPLNFAPNVPGQGYGIVTLNSGKRLCVVNLVGRCEAEWNADSPFSVLEELLKKKEADLYCVDFHAEATSEKAALAWAFDGRVSCVFGTHTHVQTADERVLPDGTGFITDLGMTGAIDSVLGILVEQSVAYFRGQPPTRYQSPKTAVKLEGCLFDIDENSGRCTGTERVQFRE